MDDIIHLARGVVEKEAAALEGLRRTIGEAFLEVVDTIVACRGRVIISGIGKSGHIALKVAGTLASTGTPSSYMHPTDGLHGDLGLVREEDLLLALTKSGRTTELVRFPGHFRRLGKTVVSICEDPRSPIAELSDHVLEIPSLPEAGPLALAPTTSAVLMLSLSDALAMAVLARRGFTEEQFARYHPEGDLGRRLLLRAEDLMHRPPELPRVETRATLKELLLEMTGKGLGMTCIVDGEGRLAGVFTDGDLRRLLTRNPDPWGLTVDEVLRQSRRRPDDTPVRRSMVTESTLAVECLRTMKTSQITALVVSADGERPSGVIRLQDIVRAGIG
ncbi:MAG: KpsF/GutQ family sugar-phosphate isomerase [Planctomycetota bacterium]